MHRTTALNRLRFGRIRVLLTTVSCEIPVP